VTQHHRRPASRDDILTARNLYVVPTKGDTQVLDDAMLFEDEEGCWVEAWVWVGNCEPGPVPPLADGEAP
jgi:hypothetical protein